MVLLAQKEEWIPQLLLKEKEEFICLKKVYTIHCQVEEIVEEKS